jgi:hypothetical protein
MDSMNPPRLGNRGNGAEMLQSIATHKAGRIALHLIAMARDLEWSWHWAGIMREVA